MSALTLAKQALSSRQIRKAITGENRFRIIDPSHPVSRKKDEEGNFLKPFFETGKFIFSAVGFLLNIGVATFSTLFTWLHQGYIALKNFNWNATDDQLEKSFDSQLVSLASIWGGTLGKAIGWSVAIGLGYGVAFFLPVVGSATLARTVATKAGAEGLDELGNAFKGALQQTARVLAQGAATTTYINIRKWFKTIPLDTLEAYFGTQNAKYIKEKWGNDGQPELSFQKWQEDRVSSIDNKYLQAFVRSLVEEAEESFFEGGYIVAHELTAAYEGAKQANQKQHGKRRTVRITPDKRIANKKEGQILLTGTETELKSMIPEVLAQHRLLVSKDIGQIVGQPAEDFASTKVLRRQLVIVYKTKQSPPWGYKEANGTREVAKQKEITIPDAIVGLSWDKIKRVCKPYNWGRFKCWVKLDNERIMSVYAASKSEAENRMKDFLTLTTAKPISWHFSEEGDKKNVRLKKKTVKIYPAYGTLLVRKPTSQTSVTGKTVGKAFEDGSILDQDIIRFDLWTSTQPVGLQPLK
ncbi:hypothetical protein TUMEXPCC7403_17010 [Tumidithrix helvetica PCC 7403]|uniref:hypothetical protein n=1 Tax=Tumidithrix helvetica TaxID=3457545 RepID=UPI003C83E1DB